MRGNNLVVDACSSYIAYAYFQYFLDYGSMLSCPSSDSRARISSRAGNETPNELGHRIGLDTSGGEALTENAALARQAVTMDTEMYWEMNYHEAAIFLEVSSPDIKPKDLTIVVNQINHFSPQPLLIRND